MDKNRKRGERIAQKSTYRHHSRDNSPGCHWSPKGCWTCEGVKDPKCKECREHLYYRGGAAALDDELDDYLTGGSW